MAIFTGQVLYPRDVDQDQGWGSNVKALLSAASSDSNWTVTFTDDDNAITQTVVPYTNISNQPADTRVNNGWAINQAEGSTDGMGSIATRTRFVPSGNWVFSIPVAYNAPALLANYTIVAQFSIYRVATGGGTRTLVFSATSNTISVNISAGTGTLTSTSSRSEIAVGVGETLHYSVRLTSIATTATLGATTNTVVTINGGTSGGLSLTLPSQGLRSNYFEYSDGVGDTVTPVDITVRKSLVSEAEGVGVFDRLAEFSRELNGVGVGVGFRTLLTVLKTLEAGGEGEGTSARLIRKDTYIADGEADGQREPNNIFKDTITSLGDGEGVFEKAVVFARQFDAEGEGERTFGKVVIFVREFNGEGESVVRPRIALDWDDLPDAGAPPVVVSKQIYLEWE
jgi:hypothetical protein